MKSNKAKDTKPELLLRKALRSIGAGGYRLHWQKAPGRPDICYPGRRLSVFVNGCYWHRCPHCALKLPKSNQEFWKKKFAANVERDLRKTRQLEAEAWQVMVIWECEIKKGPAAQARRIAKRIESAARDKTVQRAECTETDRT